jgi:DNA-binding response OmpR family regulator
MKGLPMSTPSIPVAERIEILIVEDSPTQAELLHYILTQHGYDVAVARHGREALDTLRLNGWVPTLPAH